MKTEKDPKVTMQYEGKLMYILFNGDITGMGGGQMYACNKARYMQEQGAKVLVFSGLRGSITIRGLMQYEKYIDPELDVVPTFYWRSKVQKKVSRICKTILENAEQGSEIIIESDTLHMSCWAEMVAQRLKAKHYIFMLGEGISCHNVYLPYLQFKFDRGEFAAIHTDTFQSLFPGKVSSQEAQAHVLSALCTNVVEDITDARFQKIPYDRYDCVICSLGRLDKKYILPMVEGLVAYTSERQDKKFGLIFIGGQPEVFVPDMAQVIQGKFASVPNVECWLLGQVYPIPQSFFANVHVGIASSGSSMVLDSNGVKSIVMDGVDSEPIGVLGYTTKNCLYREDEPRYSLPQLLHMVLETDYLEQFAHSRSVVKQDVSALDRHMEFVRRSDATQSYFPIADIGCEHVKQHLIKCATTVFGLEKYRKTLRWIKGLRKGAHE